MWARMFVCIYGYMHFCVSAHTCALLHVFSGMHLDTTDL